MRLFWSFLLFSLFFLQLKCTEFEEINLELIALSGDDQIGTVNEPLVESLIVQLISIDPKNNKRSSHDSIMLYVEGPGSFSPLPVITDENGIAKVEWTLGENRGIQEAIVSLDPSHASIAGNQVSFHATACPPCPESVQVGNDYYSTVFIEGQIEGEYHCQCWMTRNLDVGEMDPIASVPSSQNSKYCYENNEYFCEIFGAFYDWDMAMMRTNTEKSQGICPDRWHIPSDQEWQILERLNNMPAEKAEALDECRGKVNRVSDLLEQGGVSGFEALLAGIAQREDPYFTKLQKAGIFWTSTPYETDVSGMVLQAIVRRFDDVCDGGITRTNRGHALLANVRCIHD